MATVNINPVHHSGSKATFRKRPFHDSLSACELSSLLTSALPTPLFLCLYHDFVILSSLTVGKYSSLSADCQGFRAYSLRIVYSSRTVQSSTVYAFRRSSLSVTSKRIAMGCSCSIWQTRLPFGVTP